VIGSGILAKRYAKALFSLGLERGAPASLLTELEALVEAAQSTPQIERALFTPLHPRAQRRALIRALAERLGLSAEIRSVGQLLVDENRAALIPEIRDALRELVERAAGRVHAYAQAASPLSPAQQERLQRALSRRVSADVELHVEVNPDLIGGVVVRVGDLLLDSSLRTQLHSLAASLRKGPA
jgi:F-type H+-transporting ATPase subunit delta